MNWGSKVSPWSQRNNYATFFFSPLLFLLLILLSVVFIVSVSTLKVGPYTALSPHPKPHNTSTLVPIPPMCQFLFGCGHLGNIPKTSLNLTLCLWPSNRGGIYHVQASLGASHCKLTHADGRKWCHLSPAAVSSWLWCPLPRLISSSELLHKKQQ